MLKFNILTLFPEVFPGILQHGLLGKALSKNYFEINTINIRDYSDLSANSVDDKPFSGGAGMVLRPDIISKSIEANFNKNELDSCIKICFSAKGKKLTQKKLTNYNFNQDFILLNGRYEGIDQRVIDYYEFQEISVSDVILNGGEIASLLFIEALMRLQPGVLGNNDTHTIESFQNGLVEHDQFTRPNPWITPDHSEIEVPSILVSGKHADIDLWKHQNSLENTEKNRPDLFKNYLKKNKNE